MPKRVKKSPKFNADRNRAELLSSMERTRIEANMTLEDYSVASGRSLSFCNNEETDTRTCTVAGIIRVSERMTVTGSIAPLRALGRVHRCAVVPLPEVAPPDSELVETVARLLEHTGEAVSEIGAALSDGRILEPEFVDCRRRIRDAIEALVKAEISLEARREL